MRLLVCGSRGWADAAMIGEWLDKLKPTLLIHGGCKGADIIAGSAAKERGIEVRVYPADWAKYGKRAGFVRNQQMVDEGKPDAVLAFSDTITESNGTRMMATIAAKAGIEVYLIGHWHQPLKLKPEWTGVNFSASVRRGFLENERGG